MTRSTPTNAETATDDDLFKLAADAWETQTSSPWFTDALEAAVYAVRYRLDTDHESSLASQSLALERAQKRVEELEGALRPFAEIADDYKAAEAKRAQHHADEGRKLAPLPDHHRVSIAIGDCREARAALTATARTTKGD